MIRPTPRDRKRAVVAGVSFLPQVAFKTSQFKARHDATGMSRPWKPASLPHCAEEVCVKSPAGKEPSARKRQNRSADCSRQQHTVAPSENRCSQRKSRRRFVAFGVPKQWVPSKYMRHHLIRRGERRCISKPNFSFRYRPVS